MKSLFVVALVSAVAIAAQAVDQAAALDDEAAQPAVDGVNLKLDAFGGTWPLDGDEKGIGMGFGSVSVPLAHRFGLQIDLGGGTIDGDGAIVAAGHAFWRDPSYGLIGLYGSEFYWDKAGGLKAWRGGVEAARYWSRWTLSGIAGVEGGDSARRRRGSRIEAFEVDDGFFDQVKLSYYLIDNFRLMAGHSFDVDEHAGLLGAEWGVPLGGGRMVALYAEGLLGEGDNHAIWGGVRLYLGRRDKPLIDRHRQDDPDRTPLNHGIYINNRSGQGMPFIAPPH